jgi:hypothetical protein
VSMTKPNPSSQAAELKERKEKRNKTQDKRK